MARTSAKSVSVASLALDGENPRLPEGDEQLSQAELLKWLYDESVLDELARSMLTNGYFEHEPLLVLPQVRGQQIVLEGNRRLAALTILLQLPSALEADLRFDFETPPTVEQLDRLREVPVLTIPNRNAVRKALGFRHIGGLKSWSPESKARYLESEIDRAHSEGAVDPFREVARWVGSTTPAVRGQYLALKTLRAARDVHSINTTFVLRERFGVWIRLLNSREVREFIGLRSIATFDEVAVALGQLNSTGLQRVIDDLTPPLGGGKSVLSDSRDATIYGKILADTKANESLQKFGDLEIARQIIERGELSDRIRSMIRTIEVMIQGLDSFDLDPEVAVTADGLERSARKLRVLIEAQVASEANDRS